MHRDHEHAIVLVQRLNERFWVTVVARRDLGAGEPWGKPRIADEQPNRVPLLGEQARRSAADAAACSGNDDHRSPLLLNSL
jgi:hypothetical protein